MAKVELKQPIVDEIASNLEGAQGVVLAEYKGLTVEQDTQLRKQLREANVVYKVYKNTLVKRAIQGTAFESLTDDLNGPTAIAISTTDATAPARILAEFSKNAEALTLKSGVVEGDYYDTLLGRLLGSFQSPITNFARVLNQIAEKAGEGAEAPATEEAPAAEEAPAEAPAEESAE